MAIDIKTSSELQDSFSAMQAKLDALPGLLGNQVVGAGLAAAARVVVKTARRGSGFDDRTGLLRASFRARATSTRVGDDRTRIAGTGARVIFGGKVRGKSRAVIVAARAGGRRAYHAHLVEFGHKGGKRKLKSGLRVFVDSSARPHPFVVPAISSSLSAQRNAAAVGMEKALTKLALNLKNNKLTIRQRTALSSVRGG